MPAAGAAPPASTSVAKYHDGTGDNGRLLGCKQEAIDRLGLKTSVFKWRNPEARLRISWRYSVSHALLG